MASVSCEGDVVNVSTELATNQRHDADRDKHAVQNSAERNFQPAELYQRVSDHKILSTAVKQ